MGGSGGTFSRYNPSQIAKQVRDAEKQIDTSEFESQLANKFTQLLGQYNDRDVGLTRDRINQLVSSLETEVRGEIDTIYGGSVAKHTYVDGFSDVDTLLILDDTNLADRSPQAVLRRLADHIQQKIGSDVKLSVGSIALTLDYPDGMSLQILPALRTNGTLQVPAWNENSWARINPEQFEQGLTKRNQECGGKVIPTIKLAKAINASLPERARLSGYHIESIAIAAFRFYEGPKTTVAMLPHFFSRASDLVLKPMVDRTGQSVHVDEHLGDAGSNLRKELSYVLQRISKRMINATASRSMDQWDSLFYE